MTSQTIQIQPTVEPALTEAPKPVVAINPIRTSEQIDKIAAALAKAQGAMKHPGKNKTANVPLKTGGSYSYKYSDLADLLDEMREPFAANGLAMVQVPFNELGAVGIVTRILHESGQWIEGTLYMPVGDNKPQTIGSAITYGRRYSAGPMAGLASEEDDDGGVANAAAPETTTKKRAARAAEAPPAGQPPAVQVKRAAEAPVTTGKGKVYEGTETQALIVKGILQKKGVAEDLWPAIDDRLKGRPSGDIYKVIDEVKADAARSPSASEPEPEIEYATGDAQ